ncbi:MAG TPA: hypothetical protein PLW35_06310 [Verrucomicrobiota bacterium]|nr:hypothetical protein [Verrucomicrobiota bacterium]HOK77320.1 hypothetical protein [Verrucomicrobiota bacterium]
MITVFRLCGKRRPAFLRGNYVSVPISTPASITQTRRPNFDRVGAGKNARAPASAYYVSVPIPPRIVARRPSKPNQPGDPRRAKISF